MKYGKTIVLLIFMLQTQTAIFGQKITVSREINVRNNYAYDILPNIEDHIIFYHDRGIEHVFEIYDQNLRFKHEIQPEFEKDNIIPTGVMAMDSTFHFFYTFKESDTIVFRAIAFDKNVAIKDSITYNRKHKKEVSSNPRFAFSKDKSKVVVFTPNVQFLNIQLFDNKSVSLIYDYNLIVDGINLKNDFEKIVVANNGEIFITTQKSSMWSKDGNNTVNLIRILAKDMYSVHHFRAEEDEIKEMKLDYDNKNNRLVMAGFTTSGDESKANGYFGFSIQPNDIPEEADILINRFSTEFIAEVSGKRNKRSRELDDYVIQDLVIRNDGGVIIFSETVREFARRSQMNSPAQFGNNFPMRGFIDYYHEDLVLLATYPDGNEHWQTVMFKQQFSQDDNAVYSSFFIFKTPSRIRLLYNDEIKNSNTVSEYLIDPMGNSERRSVLSTEYQNLKLRFRDAIQTGPSSLIIPSEKSSKINMVRIDYNS
ncbi:MAG: hypothetical protein IPG48_12655 [Saprospiraceae bacterium]|nr:hypothetical protein [Saprospiraceae bacterium]